MPFFSNSSKSVASSRRGRGERVRLRLSADIVKDLVGDGSEGAEKGRERVKRRREKDTSPHAAKKKVGEKTVKIFYFFTMKNNCIDNRNAHKIILFVLRFTLCKRLWVFFSHLLLHSPLIGSDIVSVRYKIRYKHNKKGKHTRIECKHLLVQGPLDLDWKVSLVYQVGSEKEFI